MSKRFKLFVGKNYGVQKVDGEVIFDSIISIAEADVLVDLLNDLTEENEQLKQSNERIVKDIDLALGFIRHKGYSLQDIKNYEDAKNEFEEDLAYYRKGDVE